jgi:CRP/FNR family transcriptional regulator
MPFQAIVEKHISPTRFARVDRDPRPAEVEDEMTARRRALEIAASDEPLGRVAALLVSISRNNSYEGRDPRVMPDTLTSGFVADLLGLEIGSLAALLVDLRRRGLIDSDSSSTLLLKDLGGLEMLADA